MSYLLQIMPADDFLKPLLTWRQHPPLTKGGPEGFQMSWLALRNPALF
jgi:hypothetical protein